MLDMRQLQCFLAVAAELNFSVAATRLHVAQPALTRTIKRLEDRIGARLFDRDTRNVRLTAVGRAFLVEARAALTQVERAEQVARDVAQGRLGRIRIAYMSFVTHDLLAPILKGFYDARPDTRVELHNMGTEDQRAALIEGALDVAFMIGPFTAPGVASRVLREEEMVVVMTEGHELSRKRQISPLDLKGTKLVIGDKSFWSVYRSVIFNEFNRAGVSPVIGQEAPTVSAIFSLVSAGMGITIFPRAASLHYSKQLAIRPFLMQHGSISTIGAWRNDSDNAAIKTFLSCMSSHI